jgi:integrase
VLDALRAIERNSAENAKRARQLASSVYQYAIASRRAVHDPAAGLAKAFVPRKTTHRPAFTDPKQVANLLRAIGGYSGQTATIAALKTLALTFVRPAEVRKANRSEFDLDGAQWVIPAARMKMRREHVVPLSAQVVALLRPMRRSDGLVFPSLRPHRALSENTLNAALRALGYDTRTQHCAHGFRSPASTLLHELGFPYNRSARLTERRAMMQRWADYLDELQTGQLLAA